jgi:hypothetical protein
MEYGRDKVADYLTDFIMALKTQLDDDEKRWGDTWKKRPIEGQEGRTRATFNNYFDMFENGGTPVPWLKVAGNALICWIREYERDLRYENLAKDIHANEAIEDGLRETNEC